MGVTCGTRLCGLRTAQLRPLSILHEVSANVGTTGPQMKGLHPGRAALCRDPWKGALQLHFGHLLVRLKTADACGSNQALPRCRHWESRSCLCTRATHTQRPHGQDSGFAGGRHTSESQESLPAIWLVVSLGPRPGSAGNSEEGSAGRPPSCLLEATGLCFWFGACGWSGRNVTQPGARSPELPGRGTHTEPPAPLDPHLPLRCFWRGGGGWRPG